MNNQKPSNEWAFLGRGISRTIVRDIRHIALGVCAGAIFGVFGAYLFGYSTQFGLKFGAVLGAFVALLARSHMSSLFDYELPPKNKDSDS